MRYHPHHVEQEQRPDGSISSAPACPSPTTPASGCIAWAAKAPDRPAIAERTGPAWRKFPYAQLLQQVRAVDIHTHAEEPCGCHADDGYNQLQSTMACYFRTPWLHPPTIPETAAHYRAQNIAAVTFRVDAERETGYRRHKNEEVARLT